MAKLYFKYGAMGSSKSAQALITRFNYLQAHFPYIRNVQSQPRLSNCVSSHAVTEKARMQF